MFYIFEYLSQSSNGKIISNRQPFDEINLSGINFAKALVMSSVGWSYFSMFHVFGYQIHSSIFLEEWRKSAIREGNSNNFRLLTSDSKLIGVETAQVEFSYEEYSSNQPYMVQSLANPSTEKYLAWCTAVDSSLFLTVWTPSKKVTFQMDLKNKGNVNKQGYIFAID